MTPWPWQADFYMVRKNENEYLEERGGTVNAPSPHTDMVCWGTWRHHPELSIYKTSLGDFFPGQKQMLARWDDVYPLPTWEQDWYTTYYGGLGLYTYGYGIDYAISQGSLVSTIRGAGVPESIATYLLCGGANDIPTIHNEHTGPSDGVVFIASCTDTTGIGNAAGVVVMNDLNHLKLGWAESAMAQIYSWLQ